MNSTAYVTMAPCKRCFASLLSAGVERIVCRQAPPEIIAKVAQKHQIQFVDMPYYVFHVSSEDRVMGFE